MSVSHSSLLSSLGTSAVLASRSRGSRLWARCRSALARGAATAGTTTTHQRGTHAKKALLLKTLLENIVDQ